jgi:hypothetical protein
MAERQYEDEMDAISEQAKRTQNFSEVVQAVEQQKRNPLPDTYEEMTAMKVEIQALKQSMAEMQNLRKTVVDLTSQLTTCKELLAKHKIPIPTEISSKVAESHSANTTQTQKKADAAPLFKEPANNNQANKKAQKDKKDKARRRSSSLNATEDDLSGEIQLRGRKIQKFGSKDSFSGADPMSLEIPTDTLSQTSSRDNLFNDTNST